MRTRSAFLSILFVIICFIVVGCDSSSPIEASSKPSDTITLGINEVFLHKQPNFSLKVDSVLYDSRCPIGFQCFWEGNAEVRLQLSTINSKSILFKLNTANAFRKDTVIEGLKFKLIELNNTPDILKNNYQNYQVKIYYTTSVKLN